MDYSPSYVFHWGLLRFALTTVGLVIPMLGQSDVNLALVVLATGAGSLIASHVNDAGFWMFKEYFGLSMKETFATWTFT